MPDGDVVDPVGDAAEAGGVTGTADWDGAAGAAGLPGWPAFSGLFSLMTVGLAPSTRTNEYALIIR